MSDSLAPALENGLGIIELLCSVDHPIRFGEILEQLQIPKASAIRLLKVLRARGYVVKDEIGGGYLAGPRLAPMGPPGLEAEMLRRSARPLLKDLSEQTGNTALAIHFNGRQMQCLGKEMHPASASMQEVGTIMLDLDGSPWGWLFYEALDELSRKDARNEMRNVSAFERNRQERVHFYERKRFTYDDQQMYKSLRRLSAPIRSANGTVIGALGIGGNPITIPDNRVDSLGRAVAGAAQELSKAMGFNAEK